MPDGGMSMRLLVGVPKASLSLSNASDAGFSARPALPSQSLTHGRGMYAAARFPAVGVTAIESRT